MNIQNLLKYLKNDLGELTEILTDLSPGQSLSEMEIKLIKSRIRSLSEEFEMLETEIDDQSTQTSEKKPGKTVPKTQETAKPADKKPEKTTETETKAPTPPAPAPEEVATHQEAPIQEPTEQEAEPEKEEPKVPEAPPEEEQENIEEVQADEEVLQNTEPEAVSNEENSPKRTIADKYEGSSKSLHERIANMVEQKDLASKLQQNPIEDLTKAIKLNDKIWFINTLFGGDADLYRETVNRINQMDSLDEALQFLELNFKFDQREDSFKSFIEFIYRRFLN